MNDDQPRPGTFTTEHDIRLGDTIAIPKGTTVTVRKPDSGEMRGVSLQPVLQGDVSSLETLLPRITAPRFPKGFRMDPADLMLAHLEVLDFLLPTDAKQAVSRSE